MGRPHGEHGRAACLWREVAWLSGQRVAQSLPRLPGGHRRHGHPAEQHRDGPDGRGLCSRRAGRPGAGAGGHAGRQCRHDADRPGPVVRRGGDRAGLDLGRCPDVPAYLVRPARLRPRADWARPDADGAAQLRRPADAARGRAKPAPAAGRHRHATGARRAAGGRPHLGRPFECRDRAGHHVVRDPRDGATGGRLRTGVGRQSWHRDQSDPRRRRQWRPDCQAPTLGQFRQPCRRSCRGVGGAALSQPTDRDDRAQQCARCGRLPHGVQHRAGLAVLPVPRTLRERPQAPVPSAARPERSGPGDLSRSRGARHARGGVGCGGARGAAHGRRARGDADRPARRLRECRAADRSVR